MNSTLSDFTQDDKTPLHYACTFGSADLAGALLEKNSSQTFVDARDKFGDTALHIASRHGHRDVVKELLAHRANKEVVNQVRHSYSSPCVCIFFSHYLNIYCGLFLLFFDDFDRKGRLQWTSPLKGSTTPLPPRCCGRGAGTSAARPCDAVRKLRRTLTSASLTSSTCQSEMSEITENSSEESGEDETLAGDTHTYTTVWK